MIAVWTRAVVVPAWRRATAVWIGTGIAGGLVFGPTGMHPRDLTALALGVPAVGLGLALVWLLVFVPTARVLVRADAAVYLRSLPGPRWPSWLVGGAALVALQLPWLALWVIGDGARGLALVSGLSLVIAIIAAWRPRAPRATRPRWSSASTALGGVYLRALRRRAGDALVRGTGLAILAGLVAALVIRNNALDGRAAAVLGSGTLAIVLLPALAGVLVPLVDAQRASAWLASSLGVSAIARVAVLAVVVACVYLAATTIALAAAAVAFAALVGGLALATLGWLSALAVVTALGTALLAARSLVAADRSRADAASASGTRDGDAMRGTGRDLANAPVRAVTGAIVASSLAIGALAWLGAIGAVALLVLGACALLTARPA